MPRTGTKHKGIFITFEGIDGCGKTTQWRRAARFLRARGMTVTALREPGSTAVAERIRRLLLDKRLNMSDRTELLLYEAARSDLTASKIEPLLRAGKIVMCDRFYDSTTAYQGYGRRLDVPTVRKLHALAVGTVKPHLTLVFDVDLKTAFARRGRRLDRLESQPLAFHRRVRRGFLEIARREPRRVKVIDGTRPVNLVFEDVKTHLLRVLQQR
jgi:dTMP kinase